jgi:sporulation protein YlmC with PRC-barrel domain
MTAKAAMIETVRLTPSDRLKGAVLVGRKGKRLGTIRSIVVNKRSGTAEYAILRFGGLFGIGSDTCPIPWQMLSAALGADHKEGEMPDSIPTDETDRLISSEKVDGAKVFGRKGEHLGVIRNFMVDKRSGKAEYAVLEFGGFLGIGSDHYPVPWAMLEYDTAKGGYVVDLDRSRLREAPRFSGEAPTFGHDYGRRIHAYYGLGYPHV